MIAVGDVKRIVAQEFRIPMESMASKCRERDFAWPRQVAMALCRELVECRVSQGKQLGRISLPQIGHRFGHRHHTTVLHAIRAVADRRTKDPQLHQTIRRIRAQLMWEAR